MLTRPAGIVDALPITQRHEVRQTYVDTDCRADCDLRRRGSDLTDQPDDPLVTNALHCGRLRRP